VREEPEDTTADTETLNTTVKSTGAPNATVNTPGTLNTTVHPTVGVNTPAIKPLTRSLTSNAALHPTAMTMGPHNATQTHRQAGDGDVMAASSADNSGVPSLTGTLDLSIRGAKSELASTNQTGKAYYYLL
jgi:hypothetical protein